MFIYTLAAGVLYELVKIKSEPYYYFKIGLIIYVIISFLLLITIYNSNNGKPLLLILCFQVWYKLSHLLNKTRS